MRVVGSGTFFYACARDINPLPPIFLIAVDNRIGESLAHCCFDVYLGSVHIAVLPNERPDGRRDRRAYPLSCSRSEDHTHRGAETATDDLIPR